MSAENKNKKVSFVLDLEQDYGRIDDYSAFKNADELIGLFKQYNLKLTIFATGKIIECKNEIIKKFRENLDCEFQLHSYRHEINRKFTPEERKMDFEKSVESYKKYFGKNPIGFRAPRGKISKDEIDWLKKEKFLYTSNLKQKDKAFFYPNGLLEIPFSSLPLVKMPFSLSYFQLLGWPISSVLIKNKKSPYIIFNFHLHNLSKLDNIKQLKIRFRLGYIRNQNNGFKILEKFIKIMIKNKYQPITMTELAKDIQNNAI